MALTPLSKTGQTWYTFCAARPGSLPGWRGRILAGRGQMYTLLGRYITIIAQDCGRRNHRISRGKRPQTPATCYTFDPDRPGSLSGWRGRILAGRGQMYTMLQRYITIIAHFLGRLNTTILAQKSPQRAVLCTQLASTGQYLCRGGGRKIFCRKTSKWYEIHKSLQSENYIHAV